MPDQLPEGTRKRISRIRRRAIPEVRTTFEEGKITARRADTLLYLKPSKQRKELQELLSELVNRERRYRVAAETIERYLSSHTGPIDLQAVAGEIRAAIV